MHFQGSRYPNTIKIKLYLNTDKIGMSEALSQPNNPKIPFGHYITLGSISLALSKNPIEIFQPLVV